MIDFFADLGARLLPCQRSAGPEGDIVLSTTAGLSRNLWSFPFPGAASEVEMRTVSGDLFRKFGELEALAGGWYLELESLAPSQRRCLHEMNLIGAAGVERPLGKGVAVGPDLGKSLVTNEDDHLLARATAPGFAPHDALTAVLAFDDMLEELADFAFSPEFGYLTSCPTRVGTGLRLSAVMHLPGLVIADVDLPEAGRLPLRIGFVV